MSICIQHKIKRGNLIDTKLLNRMSIPFQAVKKHEEYFHERCSQLEKEFRDLLTLDIRPHQSNGTDGHYKTQL